MSLVSLKQELEEDLNRLKPMYDEACNRKSGIIDMRDNADKLWYDEYLTTKRIYDKLVNALEKSS